MPFQQADPLFFEVTPAMVLLLVLNVSVYPAAADSLTLKAPYPSCQETLRAHGTVHRAVAGRGPARSGEGHPGGAGGAGPATVPLWLMGLETAPAVDQVRPAAGYETIPS
jgi:hypothetical protein